MKLSLCITTYNRPESTIKAFEKVHNDNRIDEIVIIDDASTQENYHFLVKLLARFSKVQFYRNYKNLGMHLNKREVIEKATNEWCILFDSDNVLDEEYLDALDREVSDLKKDVIYCPAFAVPKFDYQRYCYGYIDKVNVKRYLFEQAFKCLLNTCNYVCHRDTYLKTFVQNDSIGAADSIWHIYNHLKVDNRLNIVPEMFYEHSVHEKSGWMENREHNLQKFNEVWGLMHSL